MCYPKEYRVSCFQFTAELTVLGSEEKAAGHQPTAIATSQKSCRQQVKSKKYRMLKLNYLNQKT